MKDDKGKKSNEKKQNPIVKSVNINTKVKADLMTIPGIVHVTAERTVIHREDFSLYQSVEEVLGVRGDWPKNI